MKKINWKLISDITTIIAMTAVLIGYTFLAINIKQCKQRIDDLEVMKEIYDDLHEEYNPDPKIKVD